MLASASPRRRRLLAEAGFDFEVLPARAAEFSSSEAVGPGDLPLLNSLLKARAAARLRPGCFVIGADTMIVLDGAVMGKPSSPAEAVAMLERLSGRGHRVVTGVTVIRPDGGAESFSEITGVFFKKLSLEVIAGYLQKVNVLDKAGAYAIQEHGDMLIETVSGSFSNVEGLPMERLTPLLARLFA